MLQITEVRIENKSCFVITDNPAPKFSFSLQSDNRNVCVTVYRIKVYLGDELFWDSGKVASEQSLHIVYSGKKLVPYANYTVTFNAWDNCGETATGTASFETAKLDESWAADWITDGEYKMPVKGSPKPMLFKKEFSPEKYIKRAVLYSTALGCYELLLNGKKVGCDYFAPGYTSYYHQIQYQVYDITDMLQRVNNLFVTLAGGWATGNFTYKNKNRIYADKQSFLAEIRLEYADGGIEVISTDSSWQVSMDGSLTEADFYNGEVFDANIDNNQLVYKQAVVTAPRKTPELIASYGEPVRQHEEFHPVLSFINKKGKIIYDFGQNFAGVVAAKIKGKKGQVITIRHAEVMMDDDLCSAPLRSAKAQIIYTCKDGEQFYSPTLTYMGFRYVSVEGIDKSNIELSAFALYSDIQTIGSFSCSNALINRLQQNIIWGGKSNFVDIPTDCPQRDERMGWTGDIAVFSSTACYNFDMARFLEKWLSDLSADQSKKGGIPVVIPDYKMNKNCAPVAGWGDACIMVPWAIYKANGDKSLLEKKYVAMTKYLSAVSTWASLFSFGKRKHLWVWPLIYGDWCAPKEPVMKWFAKRKWIATSYYINSSKTVARIAGILGKTEDEKYYRNLSLIINNAYKSLLTDRKGNIKKGFQSAYVCALYFGMAEGEEKKTMAKNLVQLVEKADNHLATGFLATPYLLFALSDNGYTEKAFDLLLKETCPGWLYEVMQGATTIWERWDALTPGGVVNAALLQIFRYKERSKQPKSGKGGMVSFNHYANGAVGDWLYRRIAGIEATSGGYKTFKIQPVLGGNITQAAGKIDTFYGEISSSWVLNGKHFKLDVKVPVNTKAAIILPNGESKTAGSGEYTFNCELN